MWGYSVFVRNLFRNSVTFHHFPTISLYHFLFLLHGQHFPSVHELLSRVHMIATDRKPPIFNFLYTTNTDGDVSRCLRTMDCYTTLCTEEEVRVLPLICANEEIQRDVHFKRSRRRLALLSFLWPLWYLKKPRSYFLLQVLSREILALNLGSNVPQNWLNRERGRRPGRQQEEEEEMKVHRLLLIVSVIVYLDKENQLWISERE